MTGSDLVDALLSAKTPNWDSVSLRDLTAAIQYRKRRYSYLRRFPDEPVLDGQPGALIQEIRQLYGVMVRKWSGRGLRSLDEAIASVERKGLDANGLSSFESEYLGALKSERERIAARPGEGVSPT
jgi:hypothetical protein